MDSKLSRASYAAVGRRIRRLRQMKGYSRNELARKLRVDVSSLAGWEAGKRLPRDGHRARLARALDCDLSVLLSPEDDREAPPNIIALVDAANEFPRVMADCARNARHTLRGARLASPFSTMAHVHTEWRRIVADRLVAGSLEVQCVEIFYTLDRLKETLSNVLRYDGRAYHVKAQCLGITEVGPFMGGYVFDDEVFFFGSDRAGVPPLSRPVLRLTGAAIVAFFTRYWSDVWNHGTLLNIRGAHDLSAVQAIAVSLGLDPRLWTRFVEEARELEVGDGAPPLI